ncbi:hypothetical protein FIBSPDRAFT_886941 [Athelia psychrophila]|uniref:Uncharacterized protein n=1 Tax=Athelia psychrophila TaxID=1759441 RepID=A0A166Q3S8_9AGAM|nr:hypothetical protein FIBSPDRAFT_886941 [Fibularhizoctonia sp. CBS 109695]
MNTRASNASKRPGLVDVEPKAVRRTAAEVEAERQEKLAKKEKRLQAKAEQAQRLEEVVAHVGAADASYATPIASRSRKPNTVERVESVTDLFDDAGADGTTKRPPRTARKMDGTLTKSSTAHNPGADIGVNAGAKAGSTGSRRKPPPPDAKALEGHASELGPSNATAGVAPASGLAKPVAQEAPRKNPSVVMMRRPPPNGIISRPRPPVSDSAHVSSGDGAAEKHARSTLAPAEKHARSTVAPTEKRVRSTVAPKARAISEVVPDSATEDKVEVIETHNLDDSMTEDDSQYVPPPQTKRSTASRSAAYESHTEDNDRPPKKKARQTDANKVKERSGVEEVEITDVRKQHGGVPDKEGRKMGIIDERMTSKKQGGRQANAPKGASHQTAAVRNDKMNAASAAADTTSNAFLKNKHSGPRDITAWSNEVNEDVKPGSRNLKSSATPSLTTHRSHISQSTVSRPPPSTTSQKSALTAGIKVTGLEDDRFMEKGAISDRDETAGEEYQTKKASPAKGNVRLTSKDKVKVEPGMPAPKPVSGKAKHPTNLTLPTKYHEGAIWKTRVIPTVIKAVGTHPNIFKMHPGQLAKTLQLVCRIYYADEDIKIQPGDSAMHHVRL